MRVMTSRRVQLQMKCSISASILPEESQKVSQSCIVLQTKRQYLCRSIAFSKAKGDDRRRVENCIEIYTYAVNWNLKSSYDS